MTDVISSNEDFDLLQPIRSLNDTNNNHKSLLRFQKRIQFEGTGADLLCLDYSNKLFVSISATGKFGVAISVSSSSNLNQPEEIIYCVKNLFGQEEPLLQAFARSLAEKIRVKFGVTKPLLISIGLAKEQLTQVNLLKELEKTIVEQLAIHKN